MVVVRLKYTGRSNSLSVIATQRYRPPGAEGGRHFHSFATSLLSNAFAAIWAKVFLRWKSVYRLQVENHGSQLLAIGAP